MIANRHRAWFEAASRSAGRTRGPRAELQCHPPPPTIRHSRSPGLVGLRRLRSVGRFAAEQERGRPRRAAPARAARRPGRRPPAPRARRRAPGARCAAVCHGRRGPVVGLNRHPCHAPPRLHAERGPERRIEHAAAERGARERADLVVGIEIARQHQRGPPLHLAAPREAADDGAPHGCLLLEAVRRREQRHGRRLRVAAEAERDVGAHHPDRCPRGAMLGCGPRIASSSRAGRRARRAARAGRRPRPWPRAPRWAGAPPSGCARSAALNAATVSASSALERGEPQRRAAGRRSQRRAASSGSSGSSEEAPSGSASALRAAAAPAAASHTERIALRARGLERIRERQRADRHQPERARRPVRPAPSPL